MSGNDNIFENLPLGPSPQEDPTVDQLDGSDGSDLNGNSQEFPTATQADIGAQTAPVTALENPSSAESPWPEVTSTSSFASTSTTFTSESTPSITSASSDSQNDYDGDKNGGGGGGMSNGTKIAIAVPVALVGAAILAAILFFLLRRRRRQRQLNTQPVISTPRLETSSSVFLPSQIQPVPPPPTVSISRRPVPQNETTLSPPAPEAAVVPAVATRDLEWRTSEEQRAARSWSPFDHPHDNDDALSFLSGMSDREAMMRARERDDDLSSVSSFEDEPRPATNRGGG
ncbi:hypothetical protein BJX70DRAFT_321185 [Aspergillus crustosus]